MVQDGRDLLHAAAISGNEELVHMLVEDYTLAPGFSMVNTKFVLSQRDVPDAGANLYMSLTTINFIQCRHEIMKTFHSIAYCVQYHHFI